MKVIHVTIKGDLGEAPENSSDGVLHEHCKLLHSRLSAGGPVLCQRRTVHDGVKLIRGTFTFREQDLPVSDPERPVVMDAHNHLCEVEVPRGVIRYIEQDSVTGECGPLQSVPHGEDWTEDVANLVASKINPPKP
jgi:hypothetical protein